VWSLGSLLRSWPKKTPKNPTIVILDFEGLIGYSEVNDPTQGDFSHKDTWLTALAMNLTDMDQLILMYNGNYDKSNIFITQEEGTRQSTEIMSNNFTGTWIRTLSNDLKARGTFFYDVSWVKDANDETLGEGLYDYEDMGGGLEFTHYYESDFKIPKELFYEFTVFHRMYPQYRSLLSLFDPNSTLEENEKDYMGYKLDTGYKAPIDDKTRGTIEVKFLFKDYDDKKAVDVNGIRQDNGRFDFEYEIIGTLTHALEKNILLSLRSSIIQNISNLDFYDTRNTLGLGDDRFLEGYYDYIEYEISPSVTFFHDPKKEHKKANQLQLGYAFNPTYYPGREAFDKNDNVTGEEQRDFGHTVFSRISLPINDRWTWVTSGSWTNQTSNQKFETFYRYNYRVWSALSGIRFEY